MRTPRRLKPPCSRDAWHVRARDQRTLNRSMPRQNIGKRRIDFVQALEAERALAGVQLPTRLFTSLLAARRGRRTEPRRLTRA